MIHQYGRSKDCCSANERSRYLKRCKTITVGKKTNSELEEGYLPDKIYRRENYTKHDIELATSLTTMKKAF